jgi:hypothetical protein
MKIRKIVCALFSFVFLFSCSDENLPEAEISQNMQKVSNRIGMEEAMNLVEEARTLLDENSPSKSRSSRAVNSVSALLFGNVKASAMKSGKYKDLGVSDTLAYVFNFGDSSGYAIVSKDKRVENPLFAFTERGTLINGKTDNPGLALFLERLEGYVLESIAKSGKDGEQKLMVAARGGPTSLPLNVLVSPLIPVAWGQGYPYNGFLKHDNCATTWNGRVVTGCAATAVAHIMSYFEYPTSIGSSSSYSWGFLKRYPINFLFDPYFYDSPDKLEDKEIARNMVADIFQRIGTGIDTNYDCGGSDTDPNDILGFLISNGFTLGYPYFIYYDLTDVKASLMLQRPLIAVNTCNNKECHGWVIDGLAIYPSNSNYYIHNNWGWDYQDNGYYLSGVFDPLTFNFQPVGIVSIHLQ